MSSQQEIEDEYEESELETEHPAKKQKVGLVRKPDQDQTDSDD